MRVATRADLTLEAVRRVAWDGEPVELAPAALEAMDRRHASFLALVEARLAEDPGALIYGVTTAPGDGAAVALTAERAARRPRELWTAASFGEPLPERVARAIVLARLANFVEGHAAVRGEVGVAVAEMLGGGPLPAVPARGNGGAGEILALGNLFYGLSAAMDLHPKERMALVNGSPCAAALVADVALAGRGRLRARRGATRAGRGRARGAARALRRPSSRRCGATSTRPPRCARCGRCSPDRRPSARATRRR